MSSELRATPASVTRPLVTTAIVLVGLSLVAQGIFHLTGHDVARGFIPLFSATHAEGMPALFETALLVLATAMLAVQWAATRDGRWLGFMLVLAAVTVLQATEAARWVGAFVGPVLRGVTPAVFTFGWAIPQALLAAAVVALLLPLLRSLAAEQRSAILTAIGLFLLGSVVLDAVRLRLAIAERWDTVLFSAVMTTKAAAELSGVILLLRALVAQAARGGTTARFAEG